MYGRSLHLQLDIIFITSFLQGTMFYPTKIKDRFEIFFPLSMSGDEIIKASFGRWLVGEPFSKLDSTWQAIREGMEAHRITATGLKSSTGRYNPSSSGPGPVTTGAISVFTTEEDIDEVGFEVIKIVKHDIQYKEVSADGQYRHRGDRKFIKKTLYWKKGKASFKGQLSVWNKDKQDEWHLNVVESPKPTHVDEHGEMVGYWCVETKIESLTDLWHSLREQILSGMLGPVKMECPESRGLGEANPVVFLYTAGKNKQDVRDALASYEFVKSPIYVSPREKVEGGVPSVEG